MFQHYRLSGRSPGAPGGVRDYCDLWLSDGPERRPPLVCFIDGALSDTESKAREEQLIHIPFFQQMAEDISRFTAAPFNFVSIPSCGVSLEGEGKIADLLQVISSFLAEKRENIGRLHLVGYSRGARLCLQDLIKGGFDHEEVVSFSSFSGAYLFNPKLLKKAEVQSRLKPLAISIGSGRNCPFFLANYSFHRALADLGIFHDYYLYKDHYMRSFYPLLVRSVSWLLHTEIPMYPAGKGYNEKPIAAG